MGDLTKNFSRHEFKCRCGCGKIGGSPKFMQGVKMLQKIRDKLGVPLVVCSAYRCPKHNKAVGGAAKSRHTFGDAFDIAVPKGLTVDKLAAEARAVGFTGIGRYYKQNFVHMDLWTKREWTD